MMGLLLKLKDEPVLVSSFVAAVVSLLVAFGVDISADQKAAVIGCVGAALALFTRSQVTPNSKVE
jgi:hypothetical protein